MQLNRTMSGVCSGSLHDFRWEIVENVSGLLSSPVGVIDDQVFCTSVSQFDGIARATVLGSTLGLIELESSSHFVAVAPSKWGAGIAGFGRSSFIFSVEGERINLGVPAGVTSVDIDCVNSFGVVGGSVEVRGEQCGAIWRDGVCEVVPSLRAITAMSDASELFGILPSGAPVRLRDIAEFSGSGRIVAANMEGDALVSSQNEISIWRSTGGVEAVAIRGYERISAIDWSNRGVILGFGVNARGQIEHWLFDSKVGLKVLTNQVLDSDLRLQVVSAIGRDGTMVGIALSESDRHVVRLY
ncbi:MAG: hypothetical protein ACKVQS_11190 [Fimbriimonadaceae bacterium]